MAVWQGFRQSSALGIEAINPEIADGTRIPDSRPGLASFG